MHGTDVRVALGFETQTPEMEAPSDLEQRAYRKALITLSWSTPECPQVLLAIAAALWTITLL